MNPYTKWRMKRKFEKSWLKYVNFSATKQLWDQFPPEFKEFILEEGYWSEGKGKFIEPKRKDEH